MAQTPRMTLTVTMPEPEYAELQARAKKQGVSMAQVVRSALASLKAQK